MKRRLFLLIVLSALVTTACSSATEDVTLPTRVVIATLPPLEQIVQPSPTVETTLAQAQPNPEIITVTDSPPEIASEPTATPEITVEAEQPVVVPSNTITNTPTREPTATPTETVEPLAVSFLAGLALELTIVLPTDRPYVTNTPVVIYQSTDPNNPWAVAPVQPNQPAPQVPPASTCPHLPAGVFMNVTTLHPATVGIVGCPVGEPPLSINFSGAVQVFERGLMLWTGTTPSAIYVLYNDGTMARYDDTFVQGVDPDDIGQTPPVGLIAPIRGFGKIWANNPAVQNGLGWATQSEQGLEIALHEFSQGRMVHIPQHNRIYVLGITSNRWQGVSP